LAKLAGYLGAIYASEGAGTNVPDETVTLDVSGVGNTVNENVWVNHIYKDDGGAKGEEIDRSEWSFTVKGEISCSSEAGNDIHVDYDYYTVSQIGGFFSWTLDETLEALEATDFGSGGKREYIAGQRGWTASAERHWLTEEYLSDWVGSKKIVKFYLDAQSAVRYEGWAIVTGIHPTTPVDALVNESLDFQGIGTLSFESS